MDGASFVGLFQVCVVCAVWVVFVEPFFLRINNLKLCIALAANLWVRSVAVVSAHLSLSLTRMTH